MKKLLQDFKDFAMRGNAIELAIGIIIGGAFGKIVSSLVNDVIMPIVGIFLGGVNFADLKLTLKAAVMENGEIMKPAVTMNYGNFIQVTVDFVLIAACIFLFIKLLAASRKKSEAKPAAPAAPSAEVTLLTEIRDLLKK